MGKVAIITGAGGGIGAATALLLAERGARVVLADIAQAPAEAVAARINAGGGEALAVHLDLADELSIRAMIDATLSAFGRLDILDNNAADLSMGLRDTDVETMDLEVWDRSFAVNVRGTMLACKHALPHLVKAGEGREFGGAIINTASNLALQGHIIQAAYSASKAAVIQLTRCIAASHGKRGVRCNAVLPGLTLSPTALEKLPPRLREIVEAETLTPYLGRPEDLAHAVAYLASDEARYVTGQCLVVDGGTSSHVPGIAPFRAMVAEI
ncbi:SDR family NAD(P)-dependent oxidoreductase [Nitrospirillum iridis]|uniref:NAD(P)-dependent dehydrogenase (Short-subunit alcohol dehydrogenase family) n=1 Tax=Nitrospirillum iridis TaxID=765888 RepID=A0A7X0AYK2_9PROT|nr:SDR family oxidoreductase [Nitrospirillum iridis]MBB6250959.1 NAD(P)-dependent dehydrogenase (short-subunit alcohol dehydrogenase family) [Nitrospirillum iridis]